MSELDGPLERLGVAVERMARTGGARRGRRRGRLPVRRPSLVIALVLLLLLAAAAAIAATTNLLTGEPVAERPGFTFRADTGLGRVVPGSARLTALRVADPAGGPPWGLRTLRTTRRLGCVQVGRVVDGKLGVLGQDGAFGDDGKFHELPAHVLSTSQCLALDDAGRTFIAISHSGMPAGALGYSCSARRPPAFVRRRSHAAKPPPLCPPADLRNIVYGALGPAGAAVTSRDPATGATRTQRVSGPEGAYLVVTRPTAEHPATGGWFTLRTPGSGLKSVHYTDGSVCHVVSARRAGGARPCPAKAFKADVVDPGSVRTKVTATASRGLVHPATGPPGQRRRGPAQRQIRVAFRAPVDTPDARSSYTVQAEGYGRNAFRACGFGALSGPIARTVTAGEHVAYVFWVPPRCHRTLVVTVRLHRQGRRPDSMPYAGGLDGLFVGRALVRP